MSNLIDENSGRNEGEERGEGEEEKEYYEIKLKITFKNSKI